MSQTEIFEKVKKIVADQLSVEDEKITPQSNFANDLGADSLDTVEMVMALEEEFNIEIPDEAAEKLPPFKKQWITSTTKLPHPHKRGTRNPLWG